MLPWLLHTLFHLFWQSVRSLELDGSNAEKAAPKLPLTLDNRPPLLLPLSILSVSITHPDHALPPTPPPFLSYLLLLRFISSSFSSSTLFLSDSLCASLPLSLPLCLPIIICMFHCWIMSNTHLDAPVDQKLAPFPLITLLSVTGR